MIDKNQLSHRVKMLGFVLPAKVRDVLVQGHIFLNCSLTEAFCIAILEAAACGMMVVSTNVGGVPEVLPEDLVVLADPVTSQLVSAVERAILRVPSVNPEKQHERVTQMYSWHNVAWRTEKVYQRILRATEQQHGQQPVLDRYKAVYACGPVAGKLFCIMLTIDVLVHYLLCWLWPEANIDIAPDFDFERYSPETRYSQETKYSQISRVDEEEAVLSSEALGRRTSSELGDLQPPFAGLNSDEDFDDFQVT
eukprot:TRINITY_DN7282_c0_g1_i5.p1 TRINITY_DN7282_c0_g1~~TRINITY_DN7282_c0_g1_i5.p1  ORF type:complete len:251 (-),score=66.10 TRINITY_DN7282_c0_g1_i5:98-850(-)